jgi:hypothetical protein
VLDQDTVRRIRRLLPRATDDQRAQLYQLILPTWTERKREQWQADPAAWATERLRVHLWSKQREIAHSVAANRYTAVPSCHGPGKTYAAGGVLLPWWISAHDPGTAFAITSAPTGAQIKALLWREANRSHRKAGLDGRINLTEWYLGNELVAFGRKPADTDEEAFQGIHAEKVLIVFDEANGMPKPLWDAARTLMTTHNCRWLVIGNPNSADTEFHRACESGRWNVIRIPAHATPNFTGEPVPADLARVLVTRQWVDEVAEEFGTGSDYYIAKVLAEFPAEDAAAKVLPMRYVERCRAERNFEPGQLIPRQLGVDVGAGGDKSVIQAREGRRFGPRWQTGTRDPEELGMRIVLAAREWDADLITIDANGIGWAVVGIVRMLARKAHRARVEAVMTTEKPDDPKRFYNRRAELYWRMRERFREGDLDATQLSDQAVHQLTSLRRIQDPHGRIRVENKEEFTARLGRSPDDADAVMLSEVQPRVRTRASAA